MFFNQSVTSTGPLEKKYQYSVIIQSFIYFDWTRGNYRSRLKVCLILYYCPDFSTLILFLIDRLPGRHAVCMPPSNLVCAFVSESTLERHEQIKLQIYNQGLIVGPRYVYTSIHQSCPRVTFLGPDPAKRWPDPTRDYQQKVWPDPRIKK